MAAFPFLPHRGAWASTACVVAITFVAAYQRNTGAAQFGVFSSTLLAAVLLGSTYSQLSFGVAIIAYLAAVRVIPSLRSEVHWLRRGTFGWDVWMMCLGSAGISAIALLAWFFLLRPDVGDLVEQFVPDVALPVLVLGGLLFSMLNAAVEEIAYRGIMLDALRASLPAAPAVFLQAIAFGAIHVQGFPRGWVGVGLASVYGVLMGLIRLRARGMLGPWVAHILVDLVIVGLMLLAT